MTIGMSTERYLMSELARIKFIEERDGIEGAIKFSKQTIGIYLKALKKQANGRFGYAKDPKYQHLFVTSLLAFRNYLKQHKAYY